MSWAPPDKVLFTGGHEIGGIASFAEGLSKGFAELGIPSQIVTPAKLSSHLRELRSRRVLKILSTTGMFAAPFARRSICMLHASFLVYEQGWAKTAALLACYKMANLCSAQLVAVSDYLAAHMRAFFGINVDAVIRNPVKPIYLQNDANYPTTRDYITYIGRLVSYKNIDRLIMPIIDLLNENPELRACIIGDGPERQRLERLAADHPRFEFRGQPGDDEVKQHLRRTKIFVSAHLTEGFGITYVEALSQGCVVAMPASGGGIEIALDRVGESVQLLPISLDRKGTLAVLRRALKLSPSAMPIECYSAKTAALAYLEVDRRFFNQPSSITQAAEARH